MIVICRWPKIVSVCIKVHNNDITVLKPLTFANGEWNIFAQKSWVNCGQHSTHQNIVVVAFKAFLPSKNKTFKNGYSVCHFAQIQRLHHHHLYPYDVAPLQIWAYFRRIPEDFIRFCFYKIMPSRCIKRQ